VATQFQESSALMKRAIDIGIIDPLPDVFQIMGIGEHSLLSALVRQIKEQRARCLSPSPWIGQQSSWQLPTTRRYQQSVSPSDQPITQVFPTENWSVELARWPVPFGSLGIIKSFEQYLAGVNIQGNVVYSESQSWGNPFPLATRFEWYLRLSPIQYLGYPWVNVTLP